LQIKWDYKKFCVPKDVYGVRDEGAFKGDDTGTDLHVMYSISSERIGY
jgi:hypothetical protein